jgi:hypothetical protein
MKTVLKSSIILFIFTFAILSFQITSNSTANGVSIKKEVSRAANLTNGTWIVDKLHHVILGEYSEYTRDIRNTTGIKYENLEFTFFQNGTGIHKNQNGMEYDLIWKFNEDDVRSLNLTVNNHTDKWEMFEIVGDYLYASSNLNIDGDRNNIESFRLIRQSSITPCKTNNP